jgi:hypothetical protein
MKMFFIYMKTAFEYAGIRSTYTFPLNYTNILIFHIKLV